MVVHLCRNIGKMAKYILTHLCTLTQINCYSIGSYMQVFRFCCISNTLNHLMRLRSIIDLMFKMAKFYYCKHAEHIAHIARTIIYE